MKRVLIITYYWPPSGGSGVQRWLKFAKYLPEYGWEPIIITPENPSFINRDESLLKETEGIEVLKIPIWEPYQLMDRLKGSKSHQKNVVLTGKLSPSQKLAAWIRGNLFIPDPRKFWVKPVFSFLKDFIPDRGIHHVVTTGPPHSIHLIGLRLKKKLGVQWIADFRDPWSEWDILETFRLAPWSWKKHKRLENKVLTSADHILSVGWHMNADLQRLGAVHPHVVTNGFDPADFKGLPPRKINESFVIRHIGSIDDQRNPVPFLEMIKNLNLENRTITIEFVGNVNPALTDYVSKDDWLRSNVHFREYVPHSEVIELYRNTDLLLLVLAHSKSAKLNITGKIFEYLASGTPVLGLGDPEGDAARVLKESGAGEVFLPADEPGIRSYLQKCMTEGDHKPLDLDESPFSRKKLTEKLVTILEA